MDKGPAMRTLTAAALGLFLSLTARAADFNAYRFGHELVHVGDSIMEVFRVAGEPDYSEVVESPNGGTVGKRLYYVPERSVYDAVVIHIRGGKVVGITTE